MYRFVLAWFLCCVGVLIVGLPTPLTARATAEDEPSFELGGEASKALPNYQKYCSPCHGPFGKGDGPMGEYLDTQPKDLTDADYMEGRSDHDLYLAIREGGAAVGLSDKMAPWQHLLSDKEIRDLAAFVKTLHENEP